MVKNMETKENSQGGFTVSQWHLPVAGLAVLGPLLGLVYVLALPFVVIAALVITISHRASKVLMTLFHRYNPVDLTG